MSQMTAKDLKSLPDELVELLLALTDYSGIAFGTAHGEICDDAVKPGLIAAGAATAQAAWSVHLLPTSASARAGLNDAMAAVRAAFPMGFEDELVAADAAARRWLWRRRILPEAEATAA